MKRIIALLLALLMVFALVACAAKEDSKPADDAADAPASDDAAASDAPAADGERDPYELVYMCATFGNVWCKNIEIAMKSLEEEYNFTLLSTDVDYDFDLWMTNVETYCDQGVDGFVLNCDETMTQRTFEVTSEYGIPWITESTAVRDSNGVLQTPGVELDAYGVGQGVGQLIVDNYKEYFGVDSIDPSKAALISVSYTTVKSFNDRCQGVKDTVSAEFPGITIFEPDLLAQGSITADCAYNEISPILASNPDIEYWFISGVVDDWGLGGARAAESAGIEDKTLVVSAGGEALILEWDNGYDGCWKYCYYFEAMDYVEYIIPGMIDVLDGKTTLEDLWPEWEEEGSDYASVKISGANCDSSNYLYLIKMRY